MRPEPFSESASGLVFCDDCPDLALGRYDGAPLCADCLRRTLARSGEPATAPSIEPLEGVDVRGARPAA